jgi:hypothetical protein
MKNPRITISIKDGKLSTVTSNMPMHYHIVNWDAPEEDRVNVGAVKFLIPDINKRRHGR